MHNIYTNILEKFFHSETTNDYTLEKITRACEYFGNPQDTFQSIHIAGTNGKGSTSKMIFQILKEAGKRVGVYTSPHNIDIRERFETGNCDLDHGLFPISQWHSVMSTESSVPVTMTRYIARNNEYLMSEIDFIYYAEMVVAYGWGLSYYEKCVLMAFLYFRDMGCEYGVIEVGMWGRLDATNIITPILSIITSISYDHMEFLGDTLEAIAWEKWGIIKSWIPVILYDHNYTLESIVNERSSLIIFPSERSIQTNLFGIHQQSNARIAYEAGVFLGISEMIIEQSLQHVHHRGRLEYLRSNLLIDGAHNEEGIENLRLYLNDEIEKWDTMVLAFNLKEGKSASLVLDIFDTIHDWIIINSHGFKVSDAHMIADEVIHAGKHVRMLSPDEIFSEAEQNPQKLFVVFWSLYMMGEFLNQ